MFQHRRGHYMLTILIVSANVQDRQLRSLSMKLDPADLLDSNEVANLLGLTSSTAVSTYRRRYRDFPEPLIIKGSGKCLLWDRAAIEAWARIHPRRS